jgi:hypothetical protein
MKCREPFHSTCINDYCIDCLDEDICVLCDGECTCSIGSGEALKSKGRRVESDLDSEEDYRTFKHKSGKKPIALIHSETESNSDDEEFVESDDSLIFSDANVDDVNDDSSSDLFNSSASESVYEEPDVHNDSEEDIMIEIVRDKLLNGWNSDDDNFFHSDDEILEGTFNVFPSDFEQVFGQEDEVGSVGSPVVDVVDVEPEVKVEERPQIFKEPVTPLVKVTTKTPATLLKVEELKLNRPATSTIFNSNTDVTPSKSPANPWFALAAMNMNNSILHSGRLMRTPINMSPETPTQHSTNLLKRPLTMNSVATAAAALMASPAAMRAFSELRKREKAFLN